MSDPGRTQHVVKDNVEESSENNHSELARHPIKPCQPSKDNGVDEPEVQEDVSQQESLSQPDSKQSTDKPSSANVTDQPGISGRNKSTPKCRILLVGKVGMGKATVANKIAGKELFPLRSPIQAMARDPEVRCEPANAELCGESYDLTFVLFDTRTKENMQTAFRKCFEDNFLRDGVNLILFVINEKRLTQEDTKLINVVIKCLRHDKAGEICALVVTGCEELESEQRKDLRKKIILSERTKEIAAFVQKGILLAGFPDKNSILPTLTESFEKGIEDDTRRLQDLVLNSLTGKYACEVLAETKGWFSSGRKWFSGSNHSSHGNLGATGHESPV